MAVSLMAVFLMGQKFMEMSLEGILIRECILKVFLAAFPVAFQLSLKVFLHLGVEVVDESKRDKRDTKNKKAIKRQGPQDDAKIHNDYDPIHSMNQIIN